MSWLRKRFSKKETPKEKPTLCDVEYLLPKWKEAVEKQDTGQLDAAIAAYLAIIEDCPTVISARNNLAVIFNQRREYSEALDQLEQALRPFHKESSNQLEQSFYPVYSGLLVTKSVTCSLLDQQDNAVTVLEQAGNARSAYSNLCFVQLLRGDYQAAIAAGKKAVSQDVTDPYACGNLLKAYVEAGLRDKAEDLLRRASQSLDVNLIKPGILQHRNNLLVVGYPQTKTYLVADPIKGDRFIIRASAGDLKE
jgi:tetratricopeptide (TPR) repeat protein